MLSLVRTLFVLSLRLANDDKNFLAVVADCVLRCHGPKIDHVRIIPIRNDSRLWKIIEE